MCSPCFLTSALPPPISVWVRRVLCVLTVFSVFLLVCLFPLSLSRSLPSSSYHQVDDKLIGGGGGGGRASKPQTTEEKKKKNDEDVTTTYDVQPRDAKEEKE